MSGLEQLNAAPDDEATRTLLQCCGSSNWARRMVARRPFDQLDELLLTSDRVWDSLDADDWLEAFRAHPKIGEKNAEAESLTSSRWAAQEQAGTSVASKETHDALLKANLEYEKRFGFIFIVCATGKSAEEMLFLLSQRMSNDSYTELRIAAGEQRQITQLRLSKLVNE